MNSLSFRPGAFGFLAAILIGASCMAGEARAQQSEQAVERLIGTLQEADANNDGSLTRAELTTTLRDRFGKLDRNSNGQVNAADAPRMARQKYLARVMPIIQERDRNGDGALSYAEFSARAFENFDAADKDNNDAVELQALIDAIKARAASQR